MKSPLSPEIRIDIDPASFSDWSKLLDLLHGAYAFMTARIDPPSSLLRMDQQALEQKARDETMLLAFAGETLVGCVFASRRADCLYVSKLAVSEQARRRGVARQLLQQVESLASSLSLPFVELETRIELTENHATFAALGFHKTAETAHDGHDRPTSITMRKAVGDAAL